MAQSTLSQRLSFEGLEDITKRLEAMGAAGQKSIDQIRTATDGMNSQLGKLSGVVSNLQAVAAKFESLGQAGHSAAGGVHHLGESVGGLNFEHTAQHLSLLLRGMDILDSRSIEIGQSLGKLGGVFTGVVGAIGTAVIGFGALSIAAGQATREITNQAALLGLTREQFEGLKFTAAQVGVTAEDLTRGFGRFTAKLGEAREADEKLRDSFGITQEKNRIALAKLALAADEQGLALDRNRDKQNNMRDAIASAALAAEKAQDAFKHHTDSVLHAQIAAEKAQIAYEKLKDNFTTAGKSAREVREAQLDLTEAQLRAKEAQEGIGEAEKKRKEETEALGKAYEKVQQAIAAFALAQKEAALEAKKQALIHDEEKLKLDEIRHSADEAKTVFQKLNVEIGRGAGDNLEIFEKFIDKLNGVSDAATRNALSREAFGRGWQTMGPILQLTREKLEALMHVSEKYTFESTPEELKASVALNTAYETMKITLEGLKNAIGNIIGVNFVEVFQGIADVIANNKERIRAFFHDVSDSMGRWKDAILNLAGPVLKAFWEGLKLVGDALLGIKHAFDEVADTINKFAGTKFTGEDLIAALIGVRLAVTALTFALGPMVTALTIAAAPWIALGAAILAVTALIADWIIPTKEASKLIRDTFGDAAADNFNKFHKLFEDMLVAVGKALHRFVDEEMAYFRDHWKEFLANLITDVGNFAQTLASYIPFVSQFVSLMQLAKSLTSGPGPAASAGLPPVSTPGATTTSSPTSPGETMGGSTTAYPERYNQYGNPIAHQSGGWVGERPISAESGEYVTRRSMAQRFSGLLEAINSGNLTAIADRMNSILPAPMALPAPATAGAAGGSGGGQALFHLTIGDKTFRGLSAPQDTAEALLQHARKSGLTSGSKKNSWYGS